MFLCRLDAHRDFTINDNNNNIWKQKFEYFRVCVEPHTRKIETKHSWARGGMLQHGSANGGEGMLIAFPAKIFIALYFSAQL